MGKSEGLVVSNKFVLLRCHDVKFGLCATASESSETQCLPSYPDNRRALGDRRRSSSGTGIFRLDNALEGLHWIDSVQMRQDQLSTDLVSRFVRMQLIFNENIGTGYPVRSKHRVKQIHEAEV